VKQPVYVVRHARKARGDPAASKQRNQGANAKPNDRRPRQDAGRSVVIVGRRCQARDPHADSEQIDR
jgi:hypothetical protein